nr:hypothetical protein [Tanacetum cinerariifolium]
PRLAVSWRVCLRVWILLKMDEKKFREKTIVEARDRPAAAKMNQQKNDSENDLGNLQFLKVLTENEIKAPNCIGNGSIRS